MSASEMSSIWQSRVQYSYPCASYSGVCGSGGIAPLINLGAKPRWLVSFMPRPLHPRIKNLRYPLKSMLGGPQSLPGRFAEEEYLLPLSGIKPCFTHCPACGVVAIPITLFRYPLLFCMCKKYCHPISYFHLNTVHTILSCDVPVVLEFNKMVEVVESKHN